MNDFDLDRSRWYSLMKLGLASRYAKNDAADIIKWAGNLGRFEYEPSAGTELAQAETALSEALLAVKLARSEYEKRTHLVAAE